MTKVQKVDFYVTDAWDGAFNAEVKIANTSDAEICDWALTFGFAHEIQNLWNTKVVEHTGSTYVIKNAEYNADIAANSSVHISIVAGEGAAGERPENFAMQQTVVGDASTEEEGGNGETTDDGLAGYFEYGIRDIISYYNPGNKKITLMMESEETSSSKSIYARYDNGAFVRVAVTEDSIFYVDDDAFVRTGDFMIIETDELGNKKRVLSLHL